MAGDMFVSLSLSPKSDPTLSILSSVLLLIFLPHLSLPTFPTVPLLGVGIGIRRLPEISLFCIPAKGLALQNHGLLVQATTGQVPQGVFFLCFLSLLFAKFLAAVTYLSSSTTSGPNKVAYPMLKHLPRPGIDFLLYIFNLFWSSYSFPST